MFYRKDGRTQQDEVNKKPSEFETQYSDNPTCFEVHEKWSLSCDQSSCRNWMDFSEDLNCAVVCARKNENGLSLREVADRMGVSSPRVSQIEHAAFNKMNSQGLFEDFNPE